MNRKQKHESEGIFWHKTLMDLGFKSKPAGDGIYINQHGHDNEYVTFTLMEDKLTKTKIGLDWEQSTQHLHCIIYRTTDGHILSSQRVMNIEHLEWIMKLFNKWPNK